MANFKGFKQETLTNYNALTKEDKLNYLWLVRDVDKSGETEVVKSSAIYFGSRKYAEVNGSDEELVKKINAITSALGMVAGQDGAFETYLPIGGDSILSGETITNVSEALKALSKAIVAAEATADTASKNVAALTEKVGTEAAGENPATGIYAKIDAVEQKLDPNQEGSLAKDVENAKADISTIKGQIGNETSGILGDIAGLKRDSATKDEVRVIDGKFANYYTQTEINEKLTALLRWKGSKPTLDEIKAVEGAVVGDVWHCEADNAEYVFVGGEVEDKKWEYLGVSVSLDGYVTDTALTTKLMDYATTAATDAIENRVGIVEGQVNSITAQIGEKGKDGKEGTGILGDIQKLQSSHDITGDDVE